MRVRRQAGHLSWLETELLVVAYRAQRNGQPDFHGYRAAQLVPGAPWRQSVYEALNRLAAFGFVTRRWADADVHVEPVARAASSTASPTPDAWPRSPRCWAHV
jgi:hypothetical protein